MKPKQWAYSNKTGKAEQQIQVIILCQFDTTSYSMDQAAFFSPNPTQAPECGGQTESEHNKHIVFHVRTKPVAVEFMSFFSGKTFVLDSDWDLRVKMSGLLVSTDQQTKQTFECSSHLFICLL